MEVNFRTTKKIAQSNHEIVPLDGRIAPEGCFDRSETFTSYTWPWRLWMIAKRCKLSCSKSTSRERKCVWPFCRKFEVVFSALGRNFSYFQSLLVHHLSSMAFFNHKSFCSLRNKIFVLLLWGKASFSIDIDLSTDCRNRNWTVLISMLVLAI